MASIHTLSEPFIKKGEVITAAKLNKLASGVRRMNLSPGQFMSGALALQAINPGRGGDITVNPGSSVSVQIVLIDEPIEGSEEVEDAILLPSDILPSEESEVILEDPEGTEVSQLLLRAYRPRQIAVKYFRLAVSGDPGYDPYEPTMILATTQETNSAEEIIVRYATTNVWYDDGQGFSLGQYERKDYPSFPENDSFPPEGYPENYFRHAYRGIVIGARFISGLCELLPPPPITEDDES